MALLSPDYLIALGPQPGLQPFAAVAPVAWRAWLLPWRRELLVLVAEEQPVAPGPRGSPP